jgi:hypothetical protein
METLQQAETGLFSAEVPGEGYNLVYTRVVCGRTSRVSEVAMQISRE